tara:strand:+ start:1307 stop:3460 length:2154 start_codon:yes stop_codon:yes gene_type:complete
MSYKKKQLKKIEKKIIFFFRSNSSKAFNYKQIASDFGIIDTKGRNDIIKALNILTIKNQIVEKKKGYFSTVEKKQEDYETELIILPTGKGKIFLKESGEEIIIPKKKLNRGLDGDIVAVRINTKKNTKEGEVIKIIERKKKEYVGVLEKKNDYGFVLCQKGNMYTDLFIQPNEIKSYNEGEKVVAIIKNWDENKDSPNGKIIKSLGIPGESDTEVHAILHQYGLPYEFPNQVEEEANRIFKKIKDKEIKKRKDYRKILTFTIDPDTAKDFDDALSYVINKDKSFEVGIHIADVSHYVKPNTLLDKEAYERGTSVYLVDRVVPMLPETLSNGLCSLVPNEDKYTFSAVFTFNNKGMLIKEWYGKTVINSDYRFSYNEVQHILETNNTLIKDEISLTSNEYTIPKEVLNALKKLNNVAKKLRKERMKEGAISFDRVEVKFKLDKKNNPEKVYFKNSREANKLVEEFMLLANKKVASFISKKTNVSSLFRVHDKPDEEKLSNLKKTVEDLGYALKLNTQKTNVAINNLLEECNGRKEQNLIDTLTLRSMSKAEYTTENIGHYGLAFTHYTHFTSPIRRYPDIIVHRILQNYLSNENIEKRDILEEICKHSSHREQLASKAERDSIKYMQTVYMRDKIGRRFKGVITGVTERGLFVEIIDNKCEGMVRLVDMKTDFYHIDLQNHLIRGTKTNKTFRLGDPMSIKVKKVSVKKGFIDFILAE